MGILGIGALTGLFDNDDEDNEDEAGAVVTEEEDPIPTQLPAPLEGLFDDEGDAA